MSNLLKSMSDKMHQMGDSVSSSLGLDSKVSHEHTIEHNAIKKQELESKLLNVEPGRNMPSEVGIGQGYLQKEQIGVDSRLAACTSCNSSHAAGVSCSNARGSLKQVGPDQIPGQLLSHHTTERGTLIAGELHSQARMAGGVSEVQGQLHVPAHSAAGTVLVPEHQVGARVVVPEHEQRASVLVPAMQAPGQLDVAAHGVAANLNVHDLDARARVRVESQSAAADVLIPASATAAQVSLPEKVMSAPVQRPGLEAVTNVRVAPAVGRADMEFSGLTRDMALLSTGIDQQATVVMPEQNVQATLPGGGCATIHIPKTAQTARVHAEGVSMHAHVDVANQRTQATVMMPEHMQQAHISVAPATAQAQVLIPQHSQAGTVLVPEHHQRGQLIVGAHELEGRLHVQQHVGSAQVQVAPMATGVSVSLPAKAEQASVMVGRHEGMTKVDVGGTSDAVAVALPAIDEMEKLRVTTGDAKFDLEGKPIAETRTQSSVSRSAINP